jgi:hypothetical protein
MLPKKEKTPLFFRGEQLIINLFELAGGKPDVNAFPGALSSCQGAGFEGHALKAGN